MVLVMLKMELQSMYFADLTERLGEDMKIYSTQILPPFYFKIKGCIILERIRPKINKWIVIVLIQASVRDT